MKTDITRFHIFKMYTFFDSHCFQISRIKEYKIMSYKNMHLQTPVSKNVTNNDMY